MDSLLPVTLKLDATKPIHMQTAIAHQLQKKATSLDIP